MARLKGKTAIVVGAGSIGPGWGNGKATAVTFAREGAQVFCVDRNQATAQQTVDIITSEDGAATAFTGNLPGWLGALTLLSITLGAIAANVLNVGPSGFGFLMAASGIGSLIAALAIAFGGTKHAAMLLGGLVLGAAEILIGIVGNYPIDLILMFVAGYGAITMMATANTAIRPHLPCISLIVG